MKHYGDITKINGAEVPIVDVICGGSPCQDLSIAGRREGLAGARSGLFMEQIRIIKEQRDECVRQLSMRGADDDLRHIRPRFMVWENVPGAFSSPGKECRGEDFRCVLEETARIADKDAVIPGPPDGKWPFAGCIVGNGWSLAWRVHDAEYWGVPQRRKRICLLADFNGEDAGKLLFELRRTSDDVYREQALMDPRGESGRKTQPFAESLPGDIAEGGEPGQGSAGDSGQSVENTGIFDVRISSDGTKNWRAHAYRTDICRNLDTGGADPDSNHGGIIVLNDQGGSQMDVTEEVTATLRAQEHGHAPIVLENHPTDSRIKISEDGIVQTLSTRMGTGGNNVPLIISDPVTASKASYFTNANEDETAETLVATDYKDPQIVAYRTLHSQIVRRLTPMECERLQDFPDDWTNLGEWTDSKGKKHKDADSPRYKALGNSIAVPFWQWLAGRLVKELEEPTMASLFDGIGGFPLAFSRCGCKPIWASEIEEFPIAVTKRHFPEEET